MVIEQGGIHFCYEMTYMVENDTMYIHQSEHIEPSPGIIGSGLLTIKELKEMLELLEGEI